MHLTERESEVLSWVAQGKSDWQIGKILNISSKTVNYHAENAKRKLGVATRIQAVIGAIRIGAVARMDCQLRMCVRPHACQASDCPDQGDGLAAHGTIAPPELQ
jgi:DNA-binding CsgD family transcriptional regulator